MATLICVESDVKQSVPKHCGQEMHIEAVEGKDMLVCWMGPGCGKQDIPQHHGQAMRIEA